MSHVFISYKREDELRVGRLARALEAEGVNVWWDRGLPGGESWHQNLERKLDEAGCVVVVWSANSAGPDGSYVRDEARRGLSRNMLVPIMIDPLDRLPLGFGEIQALDLTQWRGERGSADFQDLVRTIRAMLANEPMPVPKGPTRRIAKRLMWGGASGAMLVFMLLLIFNTFGMTSSLCVMPGLQPGLSDLCGSLGLGERPTREARVAWETREPGSCPALRAFAERFPDSPLVGHAADLLTARNVTTSDTWMPATRSLALFEPAGTPAANEATAQAESLARAQPSAERLCRNFGTGSLYRFVSASPRAAQWSCKRERAGIGCGFDGTAECKLEVRQRTEQERCG